MYIFKNAFCHLREAYGDKLSIFPDYGTVINECDVIFGANREYIVSQNAAGGNLFYYFSKLNKLFRKNSNIVKTIVE